MSENIEKTVSGGEFTSGCALRVINYGAVESAGIGAAGGRAPNSASS